MTNGRSPNRLPRWQEWSIYLGFGLLFSSGVIWLLLEWFVRVTGEFGPEHHPGQHWSLIVHGIAAYFFMATIGSLIPVHIKLGWVLGGHRWSGSALAGTLLLLSLTALGLYYASDELLRNWTSVIHWSLGLLSLLAIVLHVLRARS